MRPVAFAIAGAAVYIAAGAVIPFNWSHRLAEGCQWVPRRSLDNLGLARGEPTGGDNLARAICLYRKGLKSETPIPTRILNHWPSRAELTAMETSYANRLSLPAEEAP